MGGGCSPPWRRFPGCSLDTLTITYLVSVVSAVVQRRALALQAHALGSTAGTIVARLER